MTDKPPYRQALESAFARADKLQESGFAPPSVQADLEREQRRAVFSDVRRSLPRRYQTCNLKDFDIYDERQGAVIERLRQFGREIVANVDANVGLLLFGPVGTGKDHLACALLLAAAAQGISGRWVNGQRLLQAVHDAWRSGASEESVLRRYISPRVLVLSDPAMVGMSDINRQVLYRLVEARYEDARPTWVTANCSSKDEAEEMLGNATYSRMIHNAVCLACNWDDYRRRSML